MFGNILGNIISAPLRAVAAVVAAVDDQDMLGIAEASDSAAERLKQAVEYIAGEE